MLSLVGEGGQALELGRWPVPAQTLDQLSYLLAELLHAGPYPRGPEHPARGVRRCRLRSGDGDGAGGKACQTDKAGRLGDRQEPARAADGPAERCGRRLQTGCWLRRHRRLGAEDRRDHPATRLASRPVSRPSPRRARRPAVVPGELPSEVLAAVKDGTPLLAMVQRTVWPTASPGSCPVWGSSTIRARSAAFGLPWMGN
ncbi:hypothetical protein ACRAWD_15275 [Caulobacter segnis]